MKYGIMTFHSIPNVGAVLQAYALCRYLREMGHDCEIINYTCLQIVQRELTYHPLANPIKNFLTRHIVWPRVKRRIVGCSQFLTTHRMLSEQTYTQETLPNANEQYEGFISGSDMIWNLDVTHHDWSFFLDFADGHKKLFSYSSSIGDVWADADLPQIENLLRRYACLSSREQDTSQFIQDRFGINCQCTVDPTLLITPNQWRKIAAMPNERNYVLVYFPSPKLIAEAKHYAAEKGLEVAVINDGIRSFGCRSIRITDPAQWIGQFAQAEAVFTNSFHGLLFSLYFERPVWTANNGNRICSLLKLLQLDHILLNENNTAHAPRYTHSHLSDKLAALRQSSIEYLNQLN